MRIYAVADIHGKIEKIEKIRDIIIKQSPDLLVIAGDITNFFSPLKTFKRLKDIKIPIIGIRGNSDLKRVEKILKAGQSTSLLNNTPYTYKDRGFIGLNGTIPLPFLSKIALGETRLLKTVEEMITPETILVVHPPPRGILDRVGNKFCAGSIALRRFIENHPPLMVLCGHIHEQAGYQFFKRTLVVNCAMNKKFNGAIIDCDKDMPLKIKMILNKEQT